MKQDIELIQDILENGEETDDRTGTGTISTFVRSERYDLRDGKLPLVTTRKMNIKAIITELLWFIRGDSRCDYLDEHNVKIWRLWTEEKSNSIGPLYPTQLRRWPELCIEEKYQTLDVMEQGYKPLYLLKHISEDKHILAYEKYHDQLANVIKSLKENPRSRRHVISYWNVPYLPDESIDPIENVKNGKMALCPCHVLIQFHVNTKNELSCHLYMRSSDVMVGRPFNICQYSILTHMIAQICGYTAKEFIITTGDTHIYKDHLEQAKEMVTRQPYESPTLLLNKEKMDIDSFTLDDFKLVNYQHHLPLKFNVSK